MTLPFNALGMPDALVASLARDGITTATPIQSLTVPDLLQGRDVVAGAPTGSGKTLAFGLPMLADGVKGRPGAPGALILTPTRELAAQIHTELDPHAATVGLRVFAVYGGVSPVPQRKALQRGIDILVATPGRLEDLLEQRALSLSSLEVVVIDEADRMADVGFLPAVRRILEATPQRRQTVLFSATTDTAVTKLVREHLPNAVRHDVATTEVEDSRSTHLFWNVDQNDRVAICADVIARSGRTIVFTRTRRGADRVAQQLGARGVAAAAIHGSRSQSQRERALEDLRAGRIRVLVATDVAARGIHVDAITCVIHFDPPEVANDYLHRSGRTARAGASGHVVSLVVADRRRHVRQIQREVGRPEPMTAPAVASLPAAEPIVPIETKARSTRLRQEHLPERRPEGRPDSGGPGRGPRRHPRGRNPQSVVSNGPERPDRPAQSGRRRPAGAAPGGGNSRRRAPR